MPSQKHKSTTSRPSQAKQTMDKAKIKLEPVDILPLSGYVDDRVELIKQAFQCLKPKSIKAIAPEFLQNKPIEKIQEQCLNEVLGMSKKRLLSIINATKCPTDTESSDEESVRPIEEHISLDEISSEDERPKGIAKRRAKTDTNDKETEEKKEYSVLELLELQARARAIRSQLALEPVTKIEIKESDEEDVADEPPNIKPTPQSSIQSMQKSAASNASSSRNSEKSSNVRTIHVVKSTVPGVIKSKEKDKNLSRNGIEKSQIVEESNLATERRIKLKRNWRNKSQDTKEGSKIGSSNLVIEVKNPGVQVQYTNLEHARDRSTSPDVLPIVASPETFCISSDTDEEASEKRIAKKEEIVDTPAVIEKELCSPKDPDAREHKTDEPLEDGEVVDELELTIHEDDENLEAVMSEKPQQVEENKLVETAEDEKQEKAITEEKIEAVAETKKSISEEEKSDDDLNDDCIEIECTDILEEHQENVELKGESDTQNKTEPEEEILELSDSSDEDNLPLSQLIGEKSSPSKGSKAESWNSRWLESSRVSKIMATSRLGNSVRRKIKTKGKKKREVEVNETNSVEKAQVKVTESSVEVGSVEHFRELVDNQQ
ncbi:uncharacterized protein LOC132258399 isoform X1 [Phlebotomus argentipes]|uniref:uncharacterized protein LOC132258399 isoform X1 n=2 Tax=Phlebotomus argentipes TaxID=94469 RepID=UPI002892DFD4|nr:uncharacterized protein LOC132258399 isoform X1 [Phlebotomus argentipes]